MDEINLKLGDMLYYKPNNALGILVSKSSDGIEDVWKYVLRSPRSRDTNKIIIHEYEAPARKFIEGGGSGAAGWREERPLAGLCSHAWHVFQVLVDGSLQRPVRNEVTTAQRFVGHR